MKIKEPEHEILVLMSQVISEDSDKPVYPHNFTGAFSIHYLNKVYYNPYRNSVNNVFLF